MPRRRSGERRHCSRACAAAYRGFSRSSCRAFLSARARLERKKDKGFFVRAARGVSRSLARPRARESIGLEQREAWDDQQLYRLPRR